MLPPAMRIGVHKHQRCCYASVVKYRSREGGWGQTILELKRSLRCHVLTRTGKLDFQQKSKFRHTSIVKTIKLSPNKSIDVTALTSSYTI